MLGQINKLFIIGNGFDLAHGLETSYSHFIDNFWDNEKSIILSSNNYFSIKNENYYSYKDKIIEIKTPKNIKNIPKAIANKDLIGFKWFKYLLSKDLISIYNQQISYKIKNRFLRYISIKFDNLNWVDIENDYYSLLKSCYNIQFVEKKKTNYTIDILNEDFKELQDYLKNYIAQFTSNRITPNPIILDKLKKILISDGSNNPKDNILFLVFNYTNTIDEYVSFFRTNIKQNISVIYIHGEINNPQNPIIFGYGDELDDEYLKLKNANNNKLLKYIKSIKYMQTSNYSKLLRFIESYNFNAYIIGHSCGISDRTLLNTIFENRNCSSIKIFYHKREDETDDHNEKIMNISRNFKDKPSMRSKVIDKTNCEPLI